MGRFQFGRLIPVFDQTDNGLDVFADAKVNMEMKRESAVRQVDRRVELASEPWGEAFLDRVICPLGPWAGRPALRHRVGASHLLDNLEWREFSDGYHCSSHAHCAFVTAATELLFETTDFARYGASVTPLVLKNDEVILVPPSSPDAQRPQLIPLSLPPGIKTLTVVNSANTCGSWGAEPKGHTIRSIFANAPLGWLAPDTTQKKTRLAIYGDSIAAGGGADLPGVQGWGALLRRRYDVAFEASGWRRLLDDSDDLPTVAERIAAYRPGIVWIAMGVNDYQGPKPMDGDAYERTYGQFLDLLRGRLPETLVIAQSPALKVDEDKPNATGLTLADYRSICQAAVQSRPWCHYVDGGALVQLSDMPDGVHPNVDGMTEYARRVNERLERFAHQP